MAEAEVKSGTQQPRSIKARAASVWLKKIGYSWLDMKKGDYIDGHEREDVVKYRQEVFLPALQQVHTRSGMTMGMW